MKFSNVKRLIFLSIGFVLPSLSFAEDGVHALYEKANALYAKGKYQEALTDYKKIIDKGFPSAVVYYNLGNACYRMDDIPSALLYYEKAHKLSPGDDDINFNIRFANLKTSDKIDEVPEFFLARWWRSFILGISVSALAILSVTVGLLASVLLIIYFFSNAVIIKKVAFYTSLALLLICLGSILIATKQINYFEGHKQAIVFSSSVTVKSGPADKFGSLFVIHEGSKVNMFERNNGWVKIRLANGTEGWIKLTDIKEI